MAAHPAPPPAAARPLAPIIPGTSSAAAKPALAKPAAPAAASASVTDERIRELHARLVEAKRQTQDSAAVSMEGLARSMKATEAKLREQHKNRKIDFDVVIKDGKAVLKPIVR
jgi:polyhydroxyalkanoate synthesis regulator phasin